MRKKAMIFAAGLGTRLAPLTNDMPKALVLLHGHPLLWHVTKKIIAEGFDDITINTHHFAQQIKDYVCTEEFLTLLETNHAKVNISDESNMLLDTGGGLKKASSILFKEDDAPVLVHNVDIFSNACLSDLYDLIDGADALLLVSSRKTNRYLLFDEEMRLVGWTNIATGEMRSPHQDLCVSKCTMLAFSGIHVVSKSLTDSMNAWPQKFGIMDFYIKQCDKLHIRGVVQPNLCLTDIGKIETLKRLQNEL